MKIYIMSRTEDDKNLVPKVSRDFDNLSIEMNTEYEQVLKNAGHLGLGYLRDDGVLVVHYGACKYTWRIDEASCLIDDIQDEDIMIRAARKTNITKQDLLKTFDREGLMGIYNLGLKNMLDYMKEDMIITYATDCYTEIYKNKSI